MKKWIKSPLGLSLSPVIMGFILSVIYDVLKNKPILSTIWTIMQAVWIAIIAFLNLQIKIFWLIIGIVGLFALLYIVYKFIRSKEGPKPEFYNYREDSFQHWTWSWRWDWDTTENAWHVTNLQAHCPRCRTPMIEHRDIITGICFTCPRCNFSVTGRECDQPFMVERVILDNVERKNYTI